MMSYFFFVFSFVFCLSAIQANPISQSKLTPIFQPKPILPLWTLLLDSKEDGPLPRRFRTTRDHLTGNGEESGLMNLNISGSAQFSALQFTEILHKLSDFGVSPNQVFVVDLRGEPHAFINDYPVMWYAQHAWWTQSDPVSLVVANEKKHLASLSVGQNILLKRIAQKDKIGDPEVIDDYTDKIVSLKTEEQVVNDAGAHYVRIAVTDHMRPEDKDVDMFLTIVKNLPSGAWVHFHCHGGHGRTSTFMIMYDMIRNLNLSENEIINRQVLIGSVDVRQLPGASKSYKFSDQKDRLRFIHNFYKYLHAPDGYGKNSWTNWVTKWNGKLDDQSEQSNTLPNSTVAAAAA